MSSLKKIFPYTMLIVLAVPLILPVLLAVTTVPIRIINVSEPAYPGEPVVITFEVGLQTPLTVKLCNDGQCSRVWASQSYTPPGPGRYVMILVLPEKLLGLGQDRIGYVVVESLFGLDIRGFSIAPKIKVSPSSTTVVDYLGNPVSVTVEFFAYAPNEVVSQIVFKGPIECSVNVNVNIGEDGYGSAAVNLLGITGQGIPRGIYKVYGVGSITTDLGKAKNGTLEVRPQVVINRVEGHGRCDGNYCELEYITITGYGFSSSVAITKVELWNINFTNVRYVFTLPVGFTTNQYGYFSLSNLKQYIAGGKGTNITAGLYIPIVYEAPRPQLLEKVGTIRLREIGTVEISEAEVAAVLGTRATITATSFVNGTLTYIRKASRMAYTLTEVLRINITYNGRTYQIAASIEDQIEKTVRFSLYNVTEVPFKTIFTEVVPSTLNPDLGAYEANIWFNVEPPSYTTTQPPPGVYEYQATFYIYPNQILLVLSKWGLQLVRANLTITYVNKDTGTNIRRYYVHETNMSLVDTLLTIPTLKFIDANIEWSISWRYDASTEQARLTVIGRPLVGPVFEFRNVYYLVRPLLRLLTPMPVLPGQSVVIAAYGYAPGAYWRHAPTGYDDNYLDVYWEKIVRLGTFRLGKDGNTTFAITIPSDAAFGVHYIWGVDKWSYEYTLAIIVGARAFYTIPPVPPKEPIVSAGYNDMRLEVCPCPETIIGLSYCAKCIRYAGVCDYLGDVINVTIAGVTPGERISIYFGDRHIKTVIANESIVKVVFVVPTVPEGDYPIRAVGTVSGTIDITDYFNGTTFLKRLVKVRPKILLADLSKNILPVLVGPGLVRVLGTGLRPGTTFVGVLINNTDAAFILNTQVQRWGADERGVLINTYSRDIVPGLFVPALEPGVYEVKLIYTVEDITKITLPGYVVVVNNLSIVTTKFDVSAILSRLDKVVDSVERAREAASRAEAAIGAIRPIIDEIRAALGRVSTKDDISTLLKAVGDVKTAIDDVAKVVADLRVVAATKDDVKALGDVVKKLDAASTSIDSALAKLEALRSALDTSVEDLKKAVMAVRAAIPVDAISEIRDSISKAIDELTKAKNEVAALRADVTGLRADVTSTRSDVGAIKSAVDTVKGETAKIAGIEARIASVEDSVSAVRTLVIIALVFAVVAAAAAIYAVISISKALAK